MMPSSHLILGHPLLLLPSIFPSIGVFSNKSALHIRWPKYWSFSFSISPSNEYSGLISFRIDWLDFLAVQGALKNLLQHHSLKASILWRSAFFNGPTLISIRDCWRNHSFDFSCSQIKCSSYEGMWWLTYFLWGFVRVCLVTQSCLTLCDPLHCSPPGSSVHGFSRQEYWSGVPFSSFRGPSRPGDQIPISCVCSKAGGFFNH